MIFIYKTKINRMEGLKPFSMLLPIFLVSAGLAKYIYFLPFFGLVRDEAALAQVAFTILSALALAYRVFSSRIIPTANFGVMAFLLLVFVFLFGFGLSIALNFILIFLICIVEKPTLLKAFEFFRMAFCFVVAVNVVAYPFVATGLIKSFGVISPLHAVKEEAGIYYDNFGLTFVLVGLENAINVGSLFLYRMSAWFEEPGNVGTFSILILAATRFRFDRKNAVILIGGLLSFSLAFYMLLFIGIFLSSLKKTLYAVCFAFLFLLAFGDNELVQTSIIDRLDITDVSVQSTRRTSEAFDAAYEKFIETESVWFGHVPDERLYNQPQLDMSSWKGLVWDYGVVGMALYLSVFFLLSVKTLNSKEQLGRFLPFFVIFSLSVYQRPYVLDGLFVLIFYSALMKSLVVEGSRS